MRQKFIIVGNGIAAITAIKSIREVDKESEIHLFGEERFFPYNRMKIIYIIKFLLKIKK